MADKFLPARRTDMIRASLDPDDLHRELWEQRDTRNMNQCPRPHPQNDRVNNIMIAQGRVKRQNYGGKHVRYYVKDPNTWEQEAIDIREWPVEEGRVRCQFCGLDYENAVIPVGQYAGEWYKIVACIDCADLLNLEITHPLKWDKNRNLVKKA